MLVVIIKVNGSNLITDFTELMTVMVTEYKCCWHNYQILKDWGQNAKKEVTACDYFFTNDETHPSKLH